MSGSSTGPSPLAPSERGYGSFVVCPSCSHQSDIWAEHCVCGVELLPDDRKVKLAKSGGSPFVRMTRRCQRLETLGSVASREQAVRDLAALRETVEGKKHPDGSFSSGIVMNLIRLGRLDEACAEAESLPTSSLSAIEALARECHSRKDPRAERWLRQTLELRATGREHLELECALVGLLSEAGRESEALEGFERAVSELDALRKKTTKSTLAMLSGAGDAFATGYWSPATNVLDTLRGPVVRANAAAATTEGQGALAEVHHLERAGDIPAARQAAEVAARQLAGVVKRLKPLAAGLSRAEAKETMDPVEAVVHSVEAEHKRLKKLAKRS